MSGYAYIIVFHFHNNFIKDGQKSGIVSVSKWGLEKLYKIIFLLIILKMLKVY